ncbi:MAG TPA: hypothetical protein VM013_06645, partial [Dehalococcoidia bacterium]|nr:hypothetical protein [Dehalococcoidia bacterium]
ELGRLKEAQPLLQLSDPSPFSVTWQPGDQLGTLYRVEITNIGGVAATGVQVQVTQARPSIRDGLRTWLHQTDDNENGFLRTFDLPIGEETGKTIDTFYSIDAEGWQLRLYHAVSGCDRRLPRQHYVVRITASAINAPQPASRWYEVDFDQGADLRMRGIPEPMAVSEQGSEAEQQIEA